MYRNGRNYSRNLPSGGGSVQKLKCGEDLVKSFFEFSGSPLGYLGFVGDEDNLIQIFIIYCKNLNCAFSRRQVCRKFCFSIPKFGFLPLYWRIIWIIGLYLFNSGIYYITNVI